MVQATVHGPELKQSRINEIAGKVLFANGPDMLNSLTLGELDTVRGTISKVGSLLRGSFVSLVRLEWRYDYSRCREFTDQPRARLLMAAYNQYDRIKFGTDGEARHFKTEHIEGLKILEK